MSEAQEELLREILTVSICSIFVMRGLADLPSYGGEDIMLVCMLPNRMSKFGIFRFCELCESGRLCTLTGLISWPFMRCPRLIVLARGRALRNSIVDYETFISLCRA